VFSAAAPGELVAAWTEDEGWRDGSGAAIAAIPEFPWTGASKISLTAGGPPVALRVQFLDDAGQAIPMGTLSQDAVTGERLCTEYSARYYPLDDATSVIAWPNIAHPGAPDGTPQFAMRDNGDVVPLFRCDELILYPEAAGVEDIAFVLWHVNHSDVELPPLHLRVFGSNGT
jgi:hypothetical protein